MARNNFFGRFSGFSDQERVAFRKKLLIFSFFLILSSAFWILNSLNKNYTTTINYPVRYLSPSGELILTGDLPDALQLKVNANGYTIVRHSLSSKYIPISISLNAIDLQSFAGIDSALFYVETRLARDQIVEQLNSEFGIIDIQPDTLKFRFAKVVTRKMKVETVAGYELDKQLILKGALVSAPDSVTVSGPDFILDTLRQIRTLTTDFGVVTKNLTKEVSLEKIENCFFETDEVTIVLNVEKYTEKVLKVPIEPLNVPDSVTIMTFPYQVEVTCQVGLSNFEKLQSSMFRAEVDLQESGAVQAGWLSVNIRRHPDFIRNLRFTPSSVEYLKEKK
jgi:hypothetical protein